MEMKHTGFSPGDSGGSGAAQTSSGSCHVAEPPVKVRREVERIEMRTLTKAAPAVPAQLALEDDAASRHSGTSSSSSAAERRLRLAQRRRELAAREVEVLEAEKAAA